jgi:hypothetical protein
LIFFAFYGKIQKINLILERFMGLWTFEHFYAIVPAFIAFAGIAVLLGFLLKEKEKTKIWILRGLAILIIILEILKQAISISRGYDLYHLPFHYCSLFLYLLPMHAFAFGKFKKYIDGITFTACTSLFLFFVIIPTILYPAGAITTYFTQFFNFHTVTFHHLVVLYLFLAIAFRSFKLSIKRDFPICAIILSGYVIVATTLSYALDVNFQNLKKCNMPVIEENIRIPLNEAIGWFGQGLYVFVIFLGTTLFGFLSYYLISLFYKYVAKGKATIK